MATNDVPGGNPANHDELGLGCWAEHQDGSLLLVLNATDGRVIYDMFDLSQTPPVNYRDAMDQPSFEKHFSWDGKNVKWTWHDKTEFPWDRLIQKGGKDGLRYVMASDQLSAAARVAESLKIRASEFDPERYQHLRPRQARKLTSILTKVKNLMESFGQ